MIAKRDSKLFLWHSLLRSYVVLIAQQNCKENVICLSVLPINITINLPSECFRWKKEEMHNLWTFLCDGIAIRIITRITCMRYCKYRSAINFIVRLICRCTLSLAFFLCTYLITIDFCKKCTGRTKESTFTVVSETIQNCRNAIWYIDLKSLFCRYFSYPKYIIYHNSYLKKKHFKIAYWWIFFCIVLKISIIWVSENYSNNITNYAA